MKTRADNSGPVIVFALFPAMTQLDFTGPHQVLSRLPGATVILASAQGGTVEADGIAFAGLRRLGFGGAKDQAGRALLAALGLVALAEQDARGYALRSRCDLVCDGRAPLDLVHADGSVEEIAIDRDAARRLYAEAYQAARAAGFDLAREPLTLEPQQKLVAIVRRSQQLALEGEGGEAGDEA